ncbi:MAG: Amidophosphoribosyltransferase (EC [uncultured Campylobacterales bacterium]|uniref:Amidophosphoribosyltransferase n=1 Tax=uncultured Campylobacterales bacterium TaxID=352960 RepID=A0A6S6S7V3_9BACT|nr:MAG: Amidophosphoribosyltransferase (EC [uncultured Campylobacterales bacterium]
MCAVVGVYGNENASRVAYYALFAMQHRGQEASGISSSCDGKINLIKDRGLVTKIFDEKSFDILKGKCAIGHNRYSTAGEDSVLDAQPIVANYKLGAISIVHNGNLINKDEVRNDLIDKGAIYSTSMDTENLVHLIAKNPKECLQERIIEALNKTIGAYNFIIQSRKKMFVVRDRHGIRPLSLGKLQSGGYIVASETCAFDLVGAEFIRDVKPGEMLVFSPDCEEPKSIQLFNDEFRPCAFEYIYLAKPDSVIDGKTVYSVRKRIGKELAAEHKVDADIVIPVPDSGVAAALGYSQASGIPFEMAIVRNHYVGRTFIEPTQSVRDLKVRLKLSPNKEDIKGKRVVVIDDSLVRGTTSKQIVTMLKNAGAKEVHMAIAAPEIKFPCFYGIDTPTKSELMSANYTPEEIRQKIGADSICFLSIPNLVKAIGEERNYALDSFNGDYFVTK